MKNLGPIVLSLISCLIFLTSCAKLELYVDNPTEDKITFKIDNDDYIIEPYGYKKVAVSKGLHKLTYGENVTDLDIEGYMVNKKFEIVINPTKSNYISEEKILTVNPNYSSEIKHQLPLDSIRIKNVMTLHGHYEKTNDVMLIESWDYGLNEEIPESVEFNSNKEYVVLIKFSREEDFFKSRFNSSRIKN